MESLVHGMLSNAVAAAMLALAVGALSRLCRRPALIHSLWLVVLLKLVTPPVVPVSLPLLPCTQNLITGREPSISPLGDPLAVAGKQQPGHQADQLQVGFESLGPSPDDRLPAIASAPMGVGGGRPAEEWPLSEITSRGQPPPLGASRQAARSLPGAAWASGLIAMAARLPWEAWALIVVLCGAVGWWSLAAVRIIRFHHMVTDAPSVPREWQEQTDALAEQLGLYRRPEARLVPGQVPPMLWAIGGRPRLLLPTELWSSLEPDEQTSLLLHELAHLRRRDHWVRWLELIVGGLYWWHPAVWWARRALREAEEQCCDAWVVWAMPRGAKTYAAALLAALEFVSGARTAPAAASATSGNGHVSCLKRRLRMIVRASTPKGLSWIGRLAVMGMAALILPLAPSWARDNQAKPDPARSKQLTTVENTKPQFDVNARRESRARAALLARLAVDDEDDKKDDKSRDAAKRLEDQARDLIEKLSKEFGPAGEELRKVLERAVGEVHKSLEKENPSPDDLRKALEKSREEVRRALEQGGPIDNELREAWERSRKELRDAWEHARDDIRQVMRDRVEVARQRQREQAEQADQAGERPERVRPEAEGGQSDEAEARQHRQEVEAARQQIRELEQQLRRATRRLEELDRRGARRAQRRPAGRSPAEAEPPRPLAAPGAPAPPRTVPAPPAAPAPPARPGQRNVRRPRIAPGEPRLEPPPRFLPTPDYERRFRELEDKLNQLLKELKDMKGDQKPRTSAESNDKVVTFAPAGATIVA
ncbi:MAG: M56 family metallopeptidase [Isosphaeraceae bacterium]